MRKTELIAIHKLNLDKTLQIRFRNTNRIENAFRNMRRYIGRLTSWEERTCGLRVSSGLILAQETFKRIKGYGKIPDLMKSLKATSPRRSKEDKNPFEKNQSFKKSIDNNRKIEKLTAWI